jgi:hypothetical protein
MSKKNENVKEVTVEKEGFAEAVDKATDKIDNAAVKIESFCTKTGNWFKNSWKWLIATAVSFGIGFIVGGIIF